MVDNKIKTKGGASVKKDVSKQDKTGSKNVTMNRRVIVAVIAIATVALISLAVVMKPTNVTTAQNGVPPTLATDPTLAPSVAAITTSLPLTTVEPLKVVEPTPDLSQPQGVAIAYFQALRDLQFENALQLVSDLALEDKKAQLEEFKGKKQAYKDLFTNTTFRAGGVDQIRGTDSKAVRVHLITLKGYQEKPYYPIVRREGSQWKLSWDNFIDLKKLELTCSKNNVNLTIHEIRRFYDKMTIKGTLKNNNKTSATWERGELVIQFGSEKFTAFPSLPVDGVATPSNYDLQADQSKDFLEQINGYHETYPTMITIRSFGGSSGDTTSWNQPFSIEPIQCGL